MTNKQLLQSAGDGTAIPAGIIGEYLTATNGSAITPTASTTTITIASLTLTPGVWMLSGTVYWNNGATPPTGLVLHYGGIGTSANSIGANTQQFVVAPSTTANYTSVVSTGNTVVSISTNTTYYLSAAVGYTTLNNGSWTSGNSQIRAIRLA